MKQFKVTLELVDCGTKVVTEERAKTQEKAVDRAVSRVNKCIDQATLKSVEEVALGGPRCYLG